MTGQFPWHRMRPPTPTPAGPEEPEGLLASEPALERAALTDEGSHYLLRLPLPPVSPENVHVEVGDRQLIIRGQHKESTELKGDGFFRAERQVGAFHFTISLPGPVVASLAQAGFDEGILTVTLPKRV